MFLQRRASRFCFKPVESDLSADSILNLLFRFRNCFGKVKIAENTTNYLFWKLKKKHNQNATWIWNGYGFKRKVRIFFCTLFWLIINFRELTLSVVLKKIKPKSEHLPHPSIFFFKNRLTSVGAARGYSVLLASVFWAPAPGTNSSQIY